MKYKTADLEGQLGMSHMTLESLLEGRSDTIVGLNADMEVSTGYDQAHGGASAEPDISWLMDSEVMPKAERLRLADHMLAMWARYREKVLAAPN